MTTRGRKWKVVVGKFAPSVLKAGQHEPYFVGIEVREGTGNGAYRSFSRIATFWRRGHAERFASSIREDPKP